MMLHPKPSQVTPRPNFPPGSSGINISSFASQTVLRDIQKRVEASFGEAAETYVAMDADTYRQRVLALQDDLNGRKTAMLLAADRRDLICEILRTDRPLIQTNLYLRATRPFVSGVQEYIGWHRESFYGPDLSQSINFWVPVANVSVANAVRYIPDSHLIPDDEIETVNKPDRSVARFSIGHRIGLLYAPKEITAGEPPRVFRRLFCLSHATMAGSSICA
jgi:hypothetical protein